MDTTPKGLPESPKFLPPMPAESPRISHSFKRTNSSRQKLTILESEGNPMADTEDSAKDGIVQVENLSDAKQIQAAEFEDMLAKLARFEENEALLIEIDFLKIPFLFTSANLIKLLDVTPSVKTRLAIISSIGPRLMDPTAKANELRELFRYSNEQDHVMKVLKQREKIQAASRFSKAVTKTGPGPALGGRGGAGRGAGLGGRGAGPSARPASAVNSVDSKPQRTSSAPASFADHAHTGRKFDPPSINTALANGESGDDVAHTDVELSSEKSDGSPAEIVPSCRSSDNGDAARSDSPHQQTATAESSDAHPNKPADCVVDSAPTRRKSSLVIKSRAVTVKTSTQLTEEKMAAAAAALLEPKPVNTPQVKPTATHHQSSRHVHFGATKSAVGNGVNTFGSSTSHTANTVERRASTGTGRRILDAKGWMKKSEDESELANRSTVDTPSSSVPSKISIPMHPVSSTEGSVVRTLFSSVETSDRANGIASSSYDASQSSHEDSKSPREIVRRVSIDRNRSLSRTFSDNDNGPRTESEEMAEGPRSSTEGARYAKPPVPSRRSTYSYAPEETPRHPSVLPAVPLTGVLSVAQLSRAYLTSSGSKATPSASGPGELTRSRSIQASPVSNKVSWSPFTPALRQRSNSMDQEELRKAVQQLSDPRMLSNMEPEEAVGQDSDGTLLYSYIELVRRNITKSFGDLIQTELERYMSDTEFFQKFGYTKDDFAALPKWKRDSKKKNLFLF